MWVLESEGDALQGKKLWLPPGKKYVFGRTSSEVGQFTIQNKTISRQHIIVEVGPTLSADAQKPNSRSTLTLTDQNTKIGTLVNGEQIRGKSHVVSSPHNVVTLGRYEFHFTFTWVPVNLTFSFPPKEAKADPYTALYESLGPFDIKVLSEYKRGVTTHLVAKKRNTSKGLQTLIDGKYIVHNDSYVKALIAACTAPNADAKSPLEEDFGNFPDPLEYLPPRGEEPTQRDASAYAPNPIRQTMFEGYTFVFYSKRQHENLLAPIFEGGGKAVMYEITPHQSTPEEFVGFAKKAAGEKGLGPLEDDSRGRGVVVVRFNPINGVDTDWYTDFNNQVALRLDLRLIEQSELLDAILGNDASVLRRPLEFVQSGFVAPTPSATPAMSTQTLRSSPHRVPEPTPGEMLPPITGGRTARRRGASKFAFFEEEFNGPPILAPVAEAVSAESQPAVESQSQSLFVSQEMPDFREIPSLEDVQRNARKRSLPPMDYEEEKDIMDDVAPAAQAFKKRKLAAEAEKRRRGDPTPPPAAQPKAVVKPVITKSKGIRKEIDVQEHLEKQAQEAKDAEELARAEREALQEQLGDMNIKDIRNLAVIEEMPITRKAPPPRTAAHSDESDRWDERWNGRRNFKRFRPQGTGPEHRRVPNRVIVQLEEMKKKDFGIGEEYWLEDAETLRRKKKGKGRETQDTQSQAQQRPPVARKGRPTAILSSEDEGEETITPTLAPAARSQRGSKLADKTSESQNLPTQKGKRSAPTPLRKSAPAKKARAAPVVIEASDDDSDDGMKFRFNKRK